ncbi:MAG: DUF2208 family protein [Candidatus Aenigmatarchaeota archaeon]
MVLENALYGVFIIAVGVSFLTSLFYKILMDQKDVKKIKEKMSELQEKSKEAREEGNEEKAMEYQQEVMSHTTEQMKMQFKPMIATFIVIIPIFTFLFPSLYPAATVNLDETDTLTYEGTNWTVSLNSEDPLEINIDGETYSEDEIIQIDGHEFKVDSYEEGKLKMSRVAAKLPLSLPYVGSTLGWLGWYILVTLGFSQILRKLMGARP